LEIVWNVFSIYFPFVSANSPHYVCVCIYRFLTRQRSFFCSVDRDCNFEDITRPFCSYDNIRSEWRRTASGNVPTGPRGKQTLSEKFEAFDTC